jgi:hypothetical protein
VWNAPQRAWDLLVEGGVCSCRLQPRAVFAVVQGQKRANRMGTLENHKTFLPSRRVSGGYLDFPFSIRHFHLKLYFLNSKNWKEKKK